MFSARGVVRAVALFVLSSSSATSALPQAVRLVHAVADPVPITFMTSGRTPCSGEPGITDAAPCDNTPVIVASVDPCHSLRLPRVGCEEPKDAVKEDLASMGKSGQAILRARDKVLEILESDNACSAWLRQKDPNSATTFRSLKFSLDRHGEELVRVTREGAAQFTFRDPYIAAVQQGAGPFATVTLNSWGAFFQPQAPSIEIPKEGGVPKARSMRSVNVGPYFGNSLPAQTLALLHEFGHVIDLLPTDYENQEGKSVQNTAEVLRYCRAEIDSQAKHGTVQAMR